MSVAIIWENEAHTAVHLNFEPGWCWTECDRAVDEANAAIRGASHPVGIIHNLLQGPDLPLDDFVFHLHHVIHDIPENLDLIVIVGGNAVTQSILSTFFKASVGVRERVVFVDSLENARDLLAKRRTTRCH